MGSFLGFEDALGSDETADDLCRSHIKRWVEGRTVRAGDELSIEISDLFRRALLDRDLVSVHASEIKGGLGSRHVERNLVLLRQHRQTVSADLVGKIAVQADPVRTCDDEVDLALLHEITGCAVHNDGMVYAFLL